VGFNGTPAAADLDGDGDQDLAVPVVGGKVAVLSNAGSGDFAPAVLYYTAAYDSVGVADFNEDSHPDIAVAAGYTSGLVSVLMNDGAGPGPVSPVRAVQGAWLGRADRAAFLATALGDKTAEGLRRPAFHDDHAAIAEKSDLTSVGKIGEVSAAVVPGIGTSPGPVSVSRLALRAARVEWPGGVFEVFSPGGG